MLQLPRPHISRRLRDERGFTLIELLVVIMIIGVLAAIALPAFLNQRAKGMDTEARAMVRTTSIALTTFETAEDTFNATYAQLQAIEPTLNEARALTHAGTQTTYTATEQSASGTAFTIELLANGTVVRTCTKPGTGMCPAGGTW